MIQSNDELREANSYSADDFVRWLLRNVQLMSGQTVDTEAENVPFHPFGQFFASSRDGTWIDDAANFHGLLPLPAQKMFEQGLCQAIKNSVAALEFKQNRSVSLHLIQLLRQCQVFPRIDALSSVVSAITEDNGIDEGLIKLCFAVLLATFEVKKQHTKEIVTAINLAQTLRRFLTARESDESKKRRIEENISKYMGINQPIPAGVVMNKKYNIDSLRKAATSLGPRCNESAVYETTA